MKQHSGMKRARARYFRRVALWHASKLACDNDEAAWRAAWPAIGRNIEAILANEFGA